MHVPIEPDARDQLRARIWAAALRLAPEIVGLQTAEEAEAVLEEWTEELREELDALELLDPSE